MPTFDETTITEEHEEEAVEEVEEVEEEEVAEASDEESDDESVIDDDLLEKVKNLSPEALERLENIDKFYADANKTNREAAEAKREAQQLLERAMSLATEKRDDGSPDISDDERRTIEEKVLPIVEAKLKKELGQADAVIEAELLEVRDEFLEANPDIDHEKLLTTAQRFAPDGPLTPRRLEKSLEEAKDFLTRGDESDLAARLKEAEAELAKLKDAGGEVVEVKPKRTKVGEAPKSLYDQLQDDSLTSEQKMDILLQEDPPSR